MSKTTTVVRWMGAAAAAAGAVGAYAFFVEPLWLEVTRPRIHVRGLHPDLEGFRIALLTDLHAGEGTPLWLVRRAARLAMRENPDLIAVTGDLAADDWTSFAPVLDALSELRAPHGVWTVPGNHDYTVGIDRWRREVARQPNLRDLTNGAEMRRVGRARLCVAGVDDYSQGQPRLDALPPPEARDFTLLLAHDPDQAEKARREHDAVDLVVSGHTHAGQVRMPFVGALRNPAEFDELYEEGLRRRPWTQVYTSRGVGTVHIPVRFLCRPEVAILELTGAPRPPRDRARRP
ncbi:metallophosphoesterase [Longimicrobium sp.]|uniref:metallophosphoesterase n=1 Tax=Longimicrobium sp. TaxID=2029185 RepID=UPI002E345122|nr:metallophosphoesterase [Longimicrobium sp.]HEX6040813.1 metallophosphoesterase [Longimicrobium sp.]